MTLEYLKKGSFLIKFYSVASFMDKFSFMIMKFRKLWIVYFRKPSYFRVVIEKVPLNVVLNKRR